MGKIEDEWKAGIEAGLRLAASAATTGLPEGWRIGEPSGEGAGFRIIYRGEVLDGRKTAGAARWRALQIIRRRRAILERSAALRRFAGPY